jgi:hypothetical protein
VDVREAGIRYWLEPIPPERMPALATEWLAAGIGGDLLDVHEFADLDDGRRLTLHEERGFTISLRASTGPAPSDRWRYLTLEQLKRDVLTTVLPDDDDTQDQHPWEWLAGLLHFHGVEATADELRGLSYIVVFSERLRARRGVT